MSIPEMTTTSVVSTTPMVEPVTSGSSTSAQTGPNITIRSCNTKSKVKGKVDIERMKKITGE